MKTIRHEKTEQRKAQNAKRAAIRKDTERTTLREVYIALSEYAARA